MHNPVYLRPRPPFGTASNSHRLKLLEVDIIEHLSDARGTLRIKVQYIHGPALRECGRQTSNFLASFNHYDLNSPAGEASLVESGLFIGPPILHGRGIGTWVMDRVVSWVKLHAPNARALPIGRASNPSQDNVERRPKVYENLGITFDGQASRPMLVTDLKQVSPDRQLEKVDLATAFSTAVKRANQAEAKYERAKKDNAGLHA